MPFLADFARHTCAANSAKDNLPRVRLCGAVRDASARVPLHDPLTSAGRAQCATCVALVATERLQSKDRRAIELPTEPRRALPRSPAIQPALRCGERDPLGVIPPASIARPPGKPQQGSPPLRICVRQARRFHQSGARCAFPQFMRTSGKRPALNLPPACLRLQVPPPSRASSAGQACGLRPPRRGSAMCRPPPPASACPPPSRAARRPSSSGRLGEAPEAAQLTSARPLHPLSTAAAG